MTSIIGQDTLKLCSLIIAFGVLTTCTVSHGSAHESMMCRRRWIPEVIVDKHRSNQYPASTRWIESRTCPSLRSTAISLLWLPEQLSFSKTWVYRLSSLSSTTQSDQQDCRSDRWHVKAHGLSRDDVGRTSRHGRKYLFLIKAQDCFIEP